jgi:hypothetical protein
VALGETAAHRVFRGARRATDGNHSSRDRPSRPGPPIRFARIVGGDGRRRPGVAARPRQPDGRFAPKGGGWPEARAAQGRAWCRLRSGLRYSSSRCPDRRHCRVGGPRGASRASPPGGMGHARPSHRSDPPSCRLRSRPARLHPVT